MANAQRGLDRRAALGLMAVGLAAYLTGCSADRPPAPAGPRPTPSVAPVVQRQLPPVPPAHPGVTRKIDSVSPGTNRRICLTVDDGFSTDVVAGTRSSPSAPGST